MNTRFPVHWRQHVGRLQYRTGTKLLSRWARLRLKTVRVQEHTIPYLAGGEGDALILAHGFSDSKETWLLIARRLTEGYKVLLPDMPAASGARWAGSDYATPRGQAATLAAFCDAVGVTRAHIGGASMGGGVALRFATDYPQRTRSLLLVGSTSAIEPVPSEVSLALEAGINPLIVERPEDYAQVMTLVMAQPRPLPKSLSYALGARVAARAETLAQTLQAWRSAGLNDGMPRDLGRIQVPSLVIQGSEDRVIHRSIAETLACGLGDARHLELQGIGHMPQIEAPGRIARAMRAFLDSL